MAKRSKSSRRNSKEDSPPKDDWSIIYGQPDNPRTPESYATEWDHRNVEPEVGLLRESDEMMEMTHSRSECCTPVKESSPGREVVRRRKVGESKSSSPGAASKRWSRVPVAGDPSYKQWTLVATTFLIMLALLFGLSLLYASFEKGYISTFLHETTRPNLLPMFEKKLAKLKQQFPSQPNHFWGIIRSSLAEVLNNTQYTHGPAVLVILASKKDQHLATCFSEKLSTLVASTFSPGKEPIVLNGAKLRSSYDDIAAKHTIDNSVERSGRFVMQCNSLEQIPSYTASIFHSLCDYYDSPLHERAAFIFTVHTVEDVEGRQKREYDSMADKVLDEAWEDLELNKRSALIARLTGSTILLHKESRKVC